MNSVQAIPAPDTLTFNSDGAQRFRCAITPAELQGIESAILDLPPDQAGIRIHGNTGLRPYLEAAGPVGKIAASVLGPACRPVRAILFDKTQATNWALGWHQDRTIVVTERVEVDGFGPWTVKNGLVHVEPPFQLLAGMVTLRVHLDPVPANNAPLLIAPGSHRLGRIPEKEVSHVMQRCGTVVCLADTRDTWLYSTPILHASEAATTPAHRRVLQVDYAVGNLPGGLAWLGV